MTGSADELALIKLTPVEDEDTTERNTDLIKLLIELAEYGVCAPELNVEVYHPETQEMLGIAEAFWPNGFQPGIGEPIILEMDKREVDVEKMGDLDARVFYTLKSLKRYALRTTVSSNKESD